VANTLASTTLTLSEPDYKHTKSYGDSNFPVVLKMFTFLRKPLTSLLSSFSSMPTLASSDDTFSSLLSPKLSTNTDAFLDVYRQGITKTKDSEHIDALTRFLVKTITGNKLTDITSEHELLSVVVCDKNTGKEHLFYIERNASSDSTILSAATAIPTSALVSVAATAIPTTALVSAASTAISTTTQSTLQSVGPLLGTSTEFPYTPLLPLPPQAQASSRPLSRQPSHHSIPDMITLASTRVVHSSTSLSSDGLAEDRISGSGRFSGNCGGMGQIIRQIAPIELSLFELGILVDVIHNEAPCYNLIHRQCFWFMLMIFEVVLRAYDNTLDTQSGVAPDVYLPKLSGKWAGFLIVAPEKEVLDRVEKKFREQRKEEFSKVHIQVLLILINL
jgi:hypothetical protein